MGSCCCSSSSNNDLDSSLTTGKKTSSNNDQKNDRNNNNSNDAPFSSSSSEKNNKKHSEKMSFAASLQHAHVNSQSKNWMIVADDENGDKKNVDAHQVDSTTSQQWNYRRGFLATRSFDHEYLKR